MNGRFFHKRAYYLAVIARHIVDSASSSKKDRLNVDVCYESTNGDPRHTTLILRPRAGKFLPFQLLTRTSFLLTGILRVALSGSGCRWLSDRLHVFECPSPTLPLPPRDEPHVGHPLPSCTNPKQPPHHPEPKFHPSRRRHCTSPPSHTALQLCPSTVIHPQRTPPQEPRTDKRGVWVYGRDRAPEGVGEPERV